MTGAWGPIELSATEVAVFLAFIVFVPPFVIASIGAVVHAVVLSRRAGEVKPLSLFLRWWLWSTAAWVVAWFFGISIA